jgi:hypothetical protein
MATDWRPTGDLTGDFHWRPGEPGLSNGGYMVEFWPLPHYAGLQTYCPAGKDRLPLLPPVTVKAKK